jgi:hypothetical protein
MTETTPYFPNQAYKMKIPQKRGESSKKSGEWVGEFVTHLFFIMVALLWREPQRDTQVKSSKEISAKSRSTPQNKRAS